MREWGGASEWTDQWLKGKMGEWVGWEMDGYLGGQKDT